VGAVYRPAEEMEPRVVDQLTAVFVAPEMVAVNCWVPLVCRLAEVGFTVTLTVGAVLPDLILRMCASELGEVTATKQSQ
jgi:hypothetical protein